jgi:hypothetical protein
VAPIKFDVTVQRVTQKKISPDKLKEQLQFIGESAKRNRTSGWEVSIPKRLVREVERGEGESRTVHYSAVVTLIKERYIDPDAVHRKFQHTLKVMGRAARRAKWHLVGDEAMAVQSNGQLIVVNGAGEAMDDPAPRIMTELPKPVKSPFLSPGASLPPLTDEVLRKYFSRIYQREPHIRILYDNLSLAVKTRFKTRHHTLLKGPPSCAKTELYLCFIEWLGEELIEQIDASTMTKAGLERLLMQKASNGTLKPILLMEEIEKCHDENVSCLIQVMDSRGKIQRVNANTVRDGETEGAEAKIIVWGTCNKEDQLEKFHDGAIWSRFSNKLNCERPDRDLMRKILMREVAEIGGKTEWVEPVLEFCYVELKAKPGFETDFDDPRFARALLAGGDRLLDLGEEGFFSDCRRTMSGKRKK